MKGKLFVLNFRGVELSQKFIEYFQLFGQYRYEANYTDSRAAQALKKFVPCSQVKAAPIEQYLKLRSRYSIILPQGQDICTSTVYQITSACHNHVLLFYAKN